ncbi:hypothetical protein D3C87_1234090 [compost metagenome]
MTLILLLTLFKNSKILAFYYANWRNSSDFDYYLSYFDLSLYLPVLLFCYASQMSISEVGYTLHKTNGNTKNAPLIMINEYSFQLVFYF